MSCQLQPGGNSPLPDQGDLIIGLGWEPVGTDQEVDASAFLVGREGRVATDEAFVFYNNPRSPCGALQLVAGSGPDRQQFRLRFAEVPLSVERVALCLTLFGGGSFSAVRRLHIRVVGHDGSELLIFQPRTEGMVESALILGEVYRRQQQWKFRAVGQGFAGGLAPLARHFGVDVAEESATASPPPPSAVPPPPPSAARPPAPALPKAPATGVLPTGSTPSYSPQAALHYELLYPGAFTLARVDLPAGRELRAEAGAMVAMSATLEVTGKMAGGLLGGLGRLMTGEKLFLQTLQATRGAGSVYVAPATPGDIAAVELEGRGVIVQKGGFLACSEGVEVDPHMQNLAQGLFSGEGFFIMRAEGRGLLLLESFGAIHRLELRAGEQKIVDNGHLVAWSASMDYRLEMASAGIVAAMTSGEAIVCRFTGPGTLYLQSRRPPRFGLWIGRLMTGR